MSVRMTRSRTRRLLLESSVSRIPDESNLNPSSLEVSAGVDMNNNILGNVGQPNPGNDTYDSHNSKRVNGKCKEPVHEDEELVESSAPDDLDIHQQHQPHHSAHWTFFKVCNKLLSFGSLFTSPSLNRLRWKSKSRSASNSLPSLLTLIIVFIVFVFLSLCCTNVNAVCVWQGGGGFRLACGFRQSGLFRLRSLGGLKGWAGAGFTIGDEDGFKDSLSNVDPQSQQRLGAAAAGSTKSKGKSSQRVGRYAGNTYSSPSYMDPRYAAMMQQPQQYYGAYNYPNPRNVMPATTPAPKKSMWENWKWPSLLKKKSSAASGQAAAAPVRQPLPLGPFINPQLARYGQVPMAASAHGPVPMPMHVPVPMAPSQQQQQAGILHYQQQLLASQAALHAGRNSVVPALYNNGILQQRQGAVQLPMAVPTVAPNFPSFAPMPDFPALDDDPEEDAPAPSNNVGAKERQKKPYGLELLEKSPNYGKKYKIRPNPEEIENTLTSPAGPLGYDTDVFPDIYFTTTTKAKMNGFTPTPGPVAAHEDLALDIHDHTTESMMRKMKLKKIKLLKKGNKHVLMRQKLFNSTTPASELHEFSTSTLPSVTKPHRRKEPKMAKTKQTTSTTTLPTTNVGADSEEEIEDEPSSTTTTPRSKSKSKSKKGTSNPKSKTKAMTRTTTPKIVPIEDYQDEAAPQQYSPPPRPRIPTPHPRNTEPPLRPDYGEDIEYQARKTPATNYGHSNYLKIRPEVHPSEMLPERRRPGSGPMPGLPGFGNYDTQEELEHEHGPPYDQNLHRMYQEAWQYLKTSTTTEPPALLNVDYDYGAGYTHPRTVKVYDPRYPPNHEVNRGAMLPSAAAGRFPFLNPSTVATTEFPFYIKSNHFNPNTHFSRKSNQPDEHPHKFTPAEMDLRQKFLSGSVKTTMTAALNEDVGPFVKFDSGESMQLMNLTKNYNSKFYSHFNKSAGTAGRILAGQQNSFSSRSSVYPIMNNYDYYGNSATPSSSPGSGSWERSNSPQHTSEWHNRHAHFQGSPSTSPRSVPEHGNSHRWSEPTYSSASRDHHNHHRHMSREDSLEERLKSPTPPTPVSYNYWRNPGLWISQDHDLGHSPSSTHKYDRFGHGPVVEFVTDNTFRVPSKQNSNSREDEFPTNSNRKIQFLSREEIDEEAVQKYAPKKPTTVKPTQAPYHSSTPSFQEWKGYVESVGSTRDRDIYGHGPSTATPMPPMVSTTTRPKPPAVLRRRPNVSSTTAIPYRDAPAPDPFLDRLPNPDSFDAYDQQLVSPRPGSHRFFTTPRPGPDDSETSTERKNKFKIIVIDNIDSEREKQSLIKHLSSTSAPFMVSPSTLIFDKTGGAASGRSPSSISSSTARPWSSTFVPSSSFSQFDNDMDDDMFQASSSTAHNHIDEISGDVMDPIENLHQEIKKLTAQSNSVLNEYLSEYQASASGSNAHVHGGGENFDHEAAHRRRLEQFEELKRKFEEQQQVLMRLQNPSTVVTTARTRIHAHAHPSSSIRPPLDYENTTPHLERDRDPTQRVSTTHRHPSSTASSSNLDGIIMEDYVSRRSYNATNKRINGRRKSTTFQPVTITNHDVDKTTLAPIPATNLLPPMLGPIKPYVPDQMLGPPKPPAEFSTVHLNVDFENPLQQTLNNQLETDWELYSVSGVRPLSRSTEAPSPHDFKTLVEINADGGDDEDYLSAPSVMTPLTATASARTKPPPRNSSPIQPPSFFVTPSFSTTMKSVSPVRHMIPGGSSMAHPSPTPQVMIREDGTVSFSSSMRPPQPTPPTAPPRRKIMRVPPTPTLLPGGEEEHDEHEEEHEREEAHLFEHSSPASASFHGGISSYSPAVNKLGLPSSTIRYSSSTAGANKHVKVTTEAAATTPNEKESILKALETLSQAKSEVVESIVSEKFGGELPGEVIKIVPSLPTHLQKLTTSTERLTTAPATTTIRTTTQRSRKRINPPSPTPNLIQAEIASKLASLLENESKSSVVKRPVSPSPSPSAYPSPSGPSPTKTGPQSHGDIKIPQADNVHVIELDLPNTATAHGLSTASPTLESMIKSAIEKFHKDESKKASTAAPARSPPTVMASSSARPYPTSTARPHPSQSPSPSPSSMRPNPTSSSQDPTAATSPSSGQHPLAHKLAQMGLLQKLSANNLSSSQVQTIRKLIKLHQIEQKVDNAFTTSTTTPRTHPHGQVVFSSPSSPYEIIKVDENMDLNKLLGNLLQQQSTKIVHKAISNAAANANAAAHPSAAASNVQNRVLPISPSMMSFVGNLNNLPAINQMHSQMQQQQQHKQIPSQQLNHRIVNLGSSSKNNLFGAGAGPSQFPPQMQQQMPQSQSQLQLPYPTIGAHALNNGLIQVQNQNQVPLPQMIQIPPGAQGQSLQQLINQQIHQQQAQAHILNNPTLKALQALALNRAQNVRPSPQILFPQQVAPGGEPVFVNPSGDVEPAASDNRDNAMGVAGTPAPADYVDLSPLFGLSGPSMATLLKRNAQLPSYRITNIRNAPKSYHPSRDTGIIGGIDSATAELRFDPFPTELYTTFQCSDQKYFPGLYADTSNSCEVFHLCAKTETGFMMKTFRCPESTVFDQEVLRCNWNLYVDCPNAQSKYYFNKYVSQSFQFLKTLGEFSASYQKA